MAGLVAERASGLGFRELVESRILSPLGMDTATFDVDEVIARADHAVAHPSVPVDPTFTRCALVDPPGYLYASVRDLGKLTQALLAGGGGALQPQSLLEMALPHASTQSPPDMFYGLGLLERPYRGRVIIGHPGDLPGMHSAWWMVPEARFGVIMLVNGDTYSPTAAAIQAIDAFVGGDGPPPVDWSTPPSDWGRYVGYYDGRIPEGAFPPYGLGVLEVALEGEQLFLTTHEDGARYRLVQGARDTFYALVGDAGVPVTFWRDHGGQAEYLATRAGHAPRMAALPPPVRVAGAVESALLRLARQPPVVSLPMELTPPVDGDAFVDELGGDLVGVEGGGEVDVFGEAEVGELAAGGAGEKRGEQVGVGRFEGGDGGGGFGGAGSGEVGGDGAGAEGILQGGAQGAVGPAFAGGDDGEWTAQDPGPGADGGQVAKAASQDVAAGTSFDGDGGAVGRREDEARGRWQVHSDAGESE